jgi:hypothetical protein
VITCPTAGLTVATCDVTPVATATRMSFGNSSIVAPISNFVAGNAAANPATYASFDLLGLHVVTNALTTVSLEGRAAALADGVIVEVHGAYDAVAKVTTATRVEVKPAGTGLRLRGVLNVAASTIDGKLVDLTGLSAADAAVLNGLNGQIVRVKIDGSATPKVQSFKSAQRKLDDRKGAEAEIEGVIAGYDNATTGVVKFTLGGALVSVSTTPTAAVTAATLAALKDGARVEVEGTVDSAGVLVARKVELHNETKDALVEFEFHGRIVKPNPVAGATPAFVNTYDAATRTFQVWSSTVVNGTLVTTLRETIQITDDTRFTGNKSRDFSEADLANLTSSGLVVVYGRRSADGTTIIATKVKNDTSTE